MQIPKPLSEARRARSSAGAAVRAVLGLALAAFAAQAHAAMFSGEALDKVADIMAIVVLIVVPVVVIVVFWLVHVLPERFAEKRHHPQTQAIQTLCLLSLVFGGLLWPIAWLWAFTRPVGYKARVSAPTRTTGYHEAMGEQAKAGKLCHRNSSTCARSSTRWPRRARCRRRCSRLRDDLATHGCSAPRHGAPQGGRA